MPLSGTTDEEHVSTHAGRDVEPQLSATLRWIERLDYLLSRWRYLAVWTLIAVVIAGALSFFLCKFQATTQLMPPDGNSGGGGLAALLPMFGRPSSGIPMAGLAGDLLGIKSTGALFIKVMQSEAVLNAQIDRFDLMKRYQTKLRLAAEEKLLKRTDIIEDKKSGVITIRCKDRDAVAAQQLCNAYVE